MSLCSHSLFHYVYCLLFLKSTFRLVVTLRFLIGTQMYYHDVVDSVEALRLTYIAIPVLLLAIVIADRLSARAAKYFGLTLGRYIPPWPVYAPRRDDGLSFNSE